jgi:glycosyltransferase involved in cell wall biosynthesis
MEKLSLVIITFNEEKNIGRCIDSAASLADEIIVLDSFSADKTVEIARSKGARVFIEPFRGYREQKNRALELASNNYILSLDADEELDKTLQAAIAEARKTFTYSAYRMNRCTNHCGRFIRCGTWYPDRKIRLFDKRLAYWSGINPHDKIAFYKPVAVKHLRGEILHYSYPTLEKHAAKVISFSSIAAQSLYAAGRRTNLFRLVLNPSWAFVHDFLLRGGFINGRQGFVMAVMKTKYTFLKHKKLYQLQRKKFRKGVSDIQSATHTDHLAGDVITPIAGEKQSGVGDFFSRSESS